MTETDGIVTPAPPKQNRTALYVAIAAAVLAAIWLIGNATAKKHDEKPAATASPTTVTKTVTVTAAAPKPTLTAEEAADLDYIAGLREKGLEVGDAGRFEYIQRGHLACMVLRQDPDHNTAQATAGLMHKYDIGEVQARAIVIAALWVYCPALR